MIKSFDQVGECWIDLRLSQMTKSEWSNYPNHVLLIVHWSGALFYLTQARSQVEPPYKEGVSPPIRTYGLPYGSYQSSRGGTDLKTDTHITVTTLCRTRWIKEKK
jgi:hypothetical protein